MTPNRRTSQTRAVRTSQDSTVFDESCAMPIDATVFASVVAGSGSVAHNATQSLYVCSTGTSGGDRALLRSHARPRAAAQHGRSACITGSASGNTLNSTKRWGAFSDTDGFFFELQSDQLYAVRRSSVTGTPVDTRVLRGAWSVDSLANNIIDTTQQHVYEIRDVWPTGDAQFLVDGCVLHVMPSASRIRTARLPLSVECLTTSSTISSGSFAVAGTSCSVEEVPRQDRSFASSTSATGFASAAPLQAVRPLTTVSSQPNDAELELSSLTLASDGPCLVQLVHGGTVSGTFATPTGSMGESCAAPSAITGGRVIASFQVATTLALSADDASEPLRVLATGTAESLAVVVTSSTGAPITVRSALVWKETR